MHPALIAALTMLLSPMDVEEVLPSMRDSLLTGNGEAAVEMISTEGLLMVDSVMRHHPRQISEIALFFGIQLDEFDPDVTDSRVVLEDILSQPAVSGAIMVFGVMPDTPVNAGGRTFAPVYWGIFGERRTVFFELVQEEDGWKVQDFFEELP